MNTRSMLYKYQKSILIMLNHGLEKNFHLQIRKLFFILCLVFILVEFVNFLPLILVENQSDKILNISLFMSIYNYIILLMFSLTSLLFEFDG
jgi:threonine/homoserine/homoserine lactone efflux protein